MWSSCARQPRHKAAPARKHRMLTGSAAEAADRVCQQGHRRSARQHIITGRCTSEALAGCRCAFASPTAHSDCQQPQLLCQCIKLTLDGMCCSAGGRGGGAQGAAEVGSRDSRGSSPQAWEEQPKWGWGDRQQASWQREGADDRRDSSR